MCLINFKATRIILLLIGPKITCSDVGNGIN